ncbi:MAG: 50S ribosomal protein L11 methyltransferase [Bryobacteraceae bacterium]
MTVSIEFTVAETGKDHWVADLWELGSTGIQESEVAGGRTWLRAFFDEPLPEALDSIVQRTGARLVRHADKDWVAESRSMWTPFTVGKRFFLVPDWMDEPAPEGRIRIAFNPGLACGTGAHEATQLCFEALERYLRPGARVLDAGCGSGILSIAAFLLGASLVEGYDLDPMAVQIARNNLARVGVAGDVHLASAGDAPSGSFDLAFCNISPQADIELAPQIHRALAPGGIAVLSGFESFEVAEVLGALAALGYTVIEDCQKGNWCSVVYGKPAAGAG